MHNKVICIMTESEKNCSKRGSCLVCVCSDSFVWFYRQAKVILIAGNAFFLHINLHVP